MGIPKKVRRVRLHYYIELVRVRKPGSNSLNHHDILLSATRLLLLLEHISVPSPFEAPLGSTNYR